MATLMGLLIRAAIVVCFLGTSACSTHLVSLHYEPTGTVLPGPSSAVVASVSTSDNRGTDSDWLGAIRGGFGNPLKKLRTNVPTDQAVTHVMVGALRARGMLAPGTSNKVIEVNIAKFDCSYYFNREAHAHLKVSVLAPPSRAPLFERSYKTDNVESGVGAGIFGDVTHLAGFAQKTLNQTIDKILSDPAFVTALSLSGTPVATRSVAEQSGG